MVANEIKIYQKIKKKGQLSMESDITKCEKEKLIINIKRALSYPFIQKDSKISIFRESITNLGQVIALF